ncbi:hypothetical protein BKA70DRAFT_1156371, partial [Coprinopsis sp. MPI-PUGE-AT-0042]
MGATLSKLAGWGTAPVEPVLTSEAPPVPEPVVGALPIQPSGSAFVQNAQGAQNILAPMHNPTFIQNNQQGASAQDPEHLRKVLDFLSLVNFRTIQQENHSKWTPDTLKWLLEGSMFQWWLETQGAIVWGTGMPGAGKTILASVVIQDSEDHAPSDICIGYVYCRYTEPMKVRDILAALVRQLLERYPKILPVVEPLYAKHSLQRTPSTQSELIDVIRKICSRFRIARLFIDGLDEALYDKQFDLLNTLKSVPANFFITSRPLILLRDVLPNVKFFHISAEEGDITLLVSQHIRRNPALRQVLAADEQRERVIKKICESSHGMFLQASLMVAAVSHCTNYRRVMEELDKLPAELNLLYDKAFERIEMQPEEYAALAKCVLLWVAYAYRPLTVNDLQYAVASNPTLDWKTPGNLVPGSLLVSVCCGLITVEDNNRFWRPVALRTVRFVHYTALDAVRRVLERWETSPHCLLAELCIKRLMQCGVPSRRPKSLSSNHHFLLGFNHSPPLDDPFPLLDYAHTSWLLHAKEVIWCQAGVGPVTSILHFFAMYKTFPSPDQHNLNPTWNSDSPTAPIHLVVYYDLPHLLQVPLIHGQVNERTQK